MDSAGELAHGMAHETGMTAHLAFPHDSLKFGLGNECGYRVDDHKIHRAGADQHIG